MRLVTAREDALTSARVADLTAERDQLRAQNADLLATVLALKAAGPTP